MKARLLLDTHAWAWSLARGEKLSMRVRRALEDEPALLVSPISFFEIAQKVRLRKWPDMAPLLERLPSLLEEQGGAIAPLDPAVAALAGSLPWENRDPFDRLIAATALRQGLLLVSADTSFDGVVPRLW